MIPTSDCNQNSLRNHFLAAAAASVQINLNDSADTMEASPIISVTTSKASSLPTMPPPVAAQTFASSNDAPLEEITKWVDIQYTITNIQNSTSDLSTVGCKRKMDSCNNNQVDECKVSKRQQTSRTVVSLENLPCDLIGSIGSFLDVDSLNNTRLVNKRISMIMSQDGSGWLNHYNQLLERKCHVPKLNNTMVGGCSQEAARKAYIAACQDSLRDDIKSNEFIFDPEDPDRSTVWSFRFKRSAGMQWTADDPWHNGAEARHMVFLRDGTVREINLNRSVTKNEEEEANNTLEFRTPFLEVLGDGAPEVGWRCVQRPLDFKTRSNQNGSVFPYIRLTVDGRDVPTYVVRRFRPNWGFILENCWGVFTSFKMPTLSERNQRLQQLYMDIPRSLSLALSNYRNGKSLRSSSTTAQAPAPAPAPALTVNVPLYQDGHKSVESFWNLCDDSCLFITGSIQWRESMLYNIGIGKLPDSEQARIVFDDKFRLLQNTVRDRS